MKKEISDEFFAWFMNSLIVFMLIMGWVSLISRERADLATQSKGTVEACLGSRCFEEEDKGSVDVTLEPVSKWASPKRTAVEVPRARSYQVSKKIQLSAEEFNCLARNVFFESRGEPLVGKIAVSQTVFNRLRTGKWGSTVCQVVYAPSQFSWTLANHTKKPSGPEWVESRRAALLFLKGFRVTNLDKVDHYHATRISPYWNKRMTAKSVIGHHVFYASR